jgi:membrane-bound inhibitor of C-type lysozyme
MKEKMMPLLVFFLISCGDEAAQNMLDTSLSGSQSGSLEDYVGDREESTEVHESDLYDPDLDENSCQYGSCDPAPALTVTITWQEQTDIDLHLIQPDGEEVYYRNRETSAGARFIKDSCIQHNCAPETQRQETVEYEQATLGGEYAVFITNYDGSAPARVSLEAVLGGVKVLDEIISMSDERGYESQQYSFYVEGFEVEQSCGVNVDGVGLVDLETDYIPNVIACEVGDAPYEALKAAAVLARGYATYKTIVEGAASLSNSESDQVYTCAYRPNGPSELHYRAAAETAGTILTWNSNIIAPFYVAGSLPGPQDCSGEDGVDRTATEHYVTYNSGRFGCDVQMTDLGWVTSDCNRNPHNRGCLSQNGMFCLADAGKTMDDIFTNYYGEDIAVSRSSSCTP